MVEQEKDYGTKILYDPQWEGPLYIGRRATDRKALVAFVTFLFLWILISIGAFVQGTITLKPNENGVRTTHVGSSFFDKQLNNYDQQFHSDGSSSFLHVQVNNYYDQQFHDQQFHSGSSLKDLTITKSGYAIIVSGAIIISIVMSLAYLMLLRAFTKLIVYAQLIIFDILLLILAASLLVTFIKDTQQAGSLTGGIVCGFFFLVLTFLIVYNRKKINIAIEILRESVKTVFFLPSTLVYPVLPFVVCLSVIVFSSLVSISLSSLTVNGGSTTVPYIAQAINFFGFLWALFFLAGFTQMVLSGAFSAWYWTRDKRNLPNFVVSKSLSIVLKFHLGTIAIGSLILTICEIVNAILQGIADSAKRNGNVFVKILGFLLSCISQCISDIIEFITGNAYIWSSTHGTDFFTSARQSFNLLKRNVMKFFVASNVTGISIFFGQLFVILVTVGLGYLLLHGKYDGPLDKVNISAVVLLLFVCSLLTSYYIFAVVRMAERTLLLSALEDFERNDGSDLRPYFMSRGLQRAFLRDAETLLPM